MILAAVLLQASGCSIYRNKGRDQFETRSSGQVKTNIGSAAVPTEDPLMTADTQSCWRQEAQEALWSAPADAKLEVRRINFSEISVCIISDPPTTATHSEDSE